MVRIKNASFIYRSRHNTRAKGSSTREGKRNAEARGHSQTSNDSHSVQTQDVVEWVKWMTRVYCYPDSLLELLCFVAPCSLLLAYDVEAFQHKKKKIRKRTS